MCRVVHSRMAVTLGLSFFLISCAFTGAGFGQNPEPSAKIDLSNLGRLAEKASQTVDVDLDERMIRLASKFLSGSHSADEAKLKDIVSKLKGIYVKSYEFDRDGQYSESDIKPLLAQLGAPAWSKIVAAISKKNGEDVRVYVMKAPDMSIQGLAVLVIEPRELTVVNVIGPIDIEKISELEGSFGIPKLGLEPKPAHEK
ncbi:MAG TPA: DUF4252 domain-containing protein [Blastocatellia bacterium]